MTEFLEVLMINRALQSAPVIALPDTFHLRPYRDGDVAEWVRLHQEIEPETTWSADTFTGSLGQDPLRWHDRVLFLTDTSDQVLGSITAWNDAEYLGEDMGRIHWVVLDPKIQGRGLSKPLLSAAIQRLITIGYSRAYLTTSTTFLPAVNLYGAFGFVPEPRNADEHARWVTAMHTFKRPFALPPA